MVEYTIGEATRDLQNMPKEIRKELRPAIRRAAEPIVSTAKAKASWSTRIPAAISLRVLKRGVKIVVSRKKAPHARAYEGIGSDSVNFRHPVFDRDVWVTQRTRPFLAPAIQQHRAEVRAAVAKVVEDAARRHGFR